jgi:hypothetical protein
MSAHKLHHTHDGYRSGQCWADKCYCSEFEHEKPSHLRAARGPDAAASSVETPATTVSVGVVPGVVVSESSPPALNSSALAGEPLKPELRQRAYEVVLGREPVDESAVKAALHTHNERAAATPTGPAAMATRR